MENEDTGGLEIFWGSGFDDGGNHPTMTTLQPEYQNESSSFDLAHQEYSSEYPGPGILDFNAAFSPSIFEGGPQPGGPDLLAL